MPLFSVIIPVYNREKVLKRTIDSVLAQSFQDYELIIVDDGSTDETNRLARISAPGATVLEIENSGPAQARNVAAGLARGEFLAFLDSDDVWSRHALELYELAIRQTPSIIFVAGKPMSVRDYTQPSEDGSTTQSPVLCNYPDLQSSHVNILTDFTLSGVTLKRNAFLDADGFSPWRSNYEDMDLWLRLADKGPFTYIKDPVIVFKTMAHDNVSADASKNHLGIKNIIRSWKAGHYGGGMASEVSYLVENALRNLLGRIADKEWWGLFVSSRSLLLRTGRRGEVLKLLLKGLIRLTGGGKQL